LKERKKSKAAAWIHLGKTDDDFKEPTTFLLPPAPVP
jgi:hypothetical protein